MATKMTDLPVFAGSSIQDTDVFWIDVDNGDSTFTSYQISGLQLKSLITNIYNEDGAVNVVRTVTVHNSTGQVDFATTKTKIRINGTNVMLENVVSGSVTRRVNLTATEMEVKSDKVVYEKHQVYSGTYATIDAVPVNAVTFTPVTASNFQIQAEVKGYYAGTNKAYFTRIDAFYRTVAGAANQIDLSPFVQESAASGMSATLVTSGANVALELTGVSGDTATWTYIVKVF